MKKLQGQVLSIIGVTRPMSAGSVTMFLSFSVSAFRLCHEYAALCNPFEKSPQSEMKSEINIISVNSQETFGISGKVVSLWETLYSKRNC